MFEFQNSWEKTTFIKNIKVANVVHNGRSIKAYELNTSETRKLLAEAKLALKKDFKFIWSKNGKVLVQKEPGSSKENKPMVITSPDDILQLTSSRLNDSVESLYMESMDTN